MKSHRRTFLKHTGLVAVGGSLTWPWRDCLAGSFSSLNKLSRSSPEAEGVASQGILAFLDAVAASKHEFHSFVLVRHGRVVAEGWWAPYGPRFNHMLYSLSKSFTSTAMGLAVSEGRLKVTDSVTSFFPDELPEKVSEHLAGLQVRHLLTMSVGHAQDSTPLITKEQNWVKAFLSLPIPNPPGTQFLYNSGATYMLSAIVQKLSGQKVLDYLTPRLFEPLEITGMTWETCPRGINTGGWGLSIQTEGLAKFGQLYLQKGVWKGKQVLPPAWVEEATTFKIQQPSPDLERAKRESDWHQGYCYQFWRCRHNAFRGDGAFGQFTIVMPEQDAVVVITSESPSMQGELDLVWEHILPALEAHPLPPNHRSAALLKEKLAGLALVPPKAQPVSPLVPRISARNYQVEANAAGVRSISFEFTRHTCVFRLTDNKGDYHITCGLAKWVEGETSMPGTPPHLTVGDLGPVSKVAASGTWKDENTFEMTWRFYETPHHDTVTCRFDGDNVRVEFLNSLTRMSPSHKEKRPVLEGRLAANRG